MNDPLALPRFGPLTRTVLIVFLACWAGVALLARCQPDPMPAASYAERDSLPAHAWAMRELALRRELGDSAGVIARLRAQVAGREVRGPARVVVYDTVLAPPDTVYLTLQVDAGGELRADAGVRADSAGRVQPQSLVYDVSRCDDGWTLAGDGRLVCDRARMGRLSAFGRVGVGAEVGRPLWPPGEADVAYSGTTIEGGLRWTPCLRCGWGVELRAGADGRAAVQVERSVRIW